LAVVKNLLVRAGADFSSAKKSINNFQNQLSTFQNKVSSTMKAVGAALAMTGASLGLGSAVKAAMEYESAVIQIERTMGESARSFKQWAQMQGAAFGMAQTEAMKYGAVYSNLISTFAKDTAQLSTYTQQLLQAAAVTASATGRTMEDTMDRIRSGMLGNTEAIEDLGIFVGISMIESTNAFKQFANGKSWDQLSFQTQQQIRLFAILEQSVDKYGTTLAASTATKQALFIAQLKNAQLHLGQAFLPIYNAVLPALTAMATALARVTQWLASFMNALFGTKSSTQAQTSAISAQASAVEDVGDAYDKAGKKAKKASKSVAGFDQLNMVGGKAAAGGAAEGAGDGAAVSMVDGGLGEESPGAIEKIATSAEKMAEKVRGAAEKVKSAFGSMKSFIQTNSDLIIASLVGLGAAFSTYLLIGKWGAISAGITKAVGYIRIAFTALAAVIGAISWVALAVAAAIGVLVGAFVYFYRTNEQFRDTVHAILQKIGDTAIWLWNNALVPLGNWLTSVFVTAWQGVTKAAEWLWKNILVPFGNFLKWLWTSVLVPIGKIIGEVLAIAFKTVSDIAKSFWQNVLVPLGNALKEMLGPAIEAVTAVLTFLWENAFQPFGNFIKTKIMPIVEDLIKVFESLWKNILKPLALYLSEGFSNVFNTVFESIGGLIEGVKTAFIGLMNFITGVFTGDWEKAWEGVKKIFKGVFDTFYSIVKYPLNLIIDAINTVIGGLNKISFDIPDWVPGIGGKDFGINIPKIPKLAVGTNYVQRDGLAFLHEGEAVVPKKYNPAAGGGDNAEVVAALNRVERAVSGLKQVKAVISGNEVGRAATGFINSEYRRGNNPLPSL